MDFATHLKPDHVLIYDGFPDTTHFFAGFCHHLKTQGIVAEEKRIKRLFVKREMLHTTAIGCGAAAPHIYAPDFPGFTVFLVWLRQGLDFKASDGLPVRLIYLIMSDERDVGLHLKSLAHFARLVCHTDIVATLEKTTTPAEIHQLLLDREKKIL